MIHYEHYAQFPVSNDWKRLTQWVAKITETHPVLRNHDNTANSQCVEKHMYPQLLPRCLNVYPLGCIDKAGQRQRTNIGTHIEDNTSKFFQCSRYFANRQQHTQEQKHHHSHLLLHRGWSHWTILQTIFMSWQWSSRTSSGTDWFQSVRLL